MARTKLNGVRDYAALFKARTGVDRHPPVNATAEELAKYHEDVSTRDKKSMGTLADSSKWRRLRAERVRAYRKNIQSYTRSTRDHMCTLTQQQAEVEERREEAERKKWKEVMEAFSAKMDEEEGKPRRPWYIEKEKPTLGG